MANTRPAIGDGPTAKVPAKGARTKKIGKSNNPAKKTVAKTAATDGSDCPSESPSPSPLVLLTPPVACATDCLRHIYSAIDKTCRHKSKPALTTFITTARAARVIENLAIDIRTPYLAALDIAFPSLRGRTRFIAGKLQLTGRASCARFRTRFDGFVRDFGFPLFSICAHARKFRDVLFEATGDDEVQAAENEACYAALCALLRANAYSLELFARTRGLDWKTPLIELNNSWKDLIIHSLRNVLDQFNIYNEVRVYGISDTDYLLRHELPDDGGHPHEWAVCSDPRAAITPKMRYLQGKSNREETQVNIDSAIIITGKFRWFDRVKWPHPDPRYRGMYVACEACGGECNNGIANMQSCTCTPTDLCNSRQINLAKQHSLIELTQYPGKGIGVRALKHFANGEILGEYLGELYPALTIRDDETLRNELYPNSEGISYQMSQGLMDRGDGPRRITARESPAFMIDPAVKGNWTRYVNHSCRNNAAVERMVVGNLNLLLVIVRCANGIRFGEEITIDYGDEFWRDKEYGCNCRESRCKYWDVDQNRKKPARKVTLGEERERRRLETEATKEARAGEEKPGEETAAEIKKPRRTLKLIMDPSSNEQSNRRKWDDDHNEGSQLPVKRPRTSK